mgnify:CR=1 FL=1
MICGACSCSIRLHREALDQEVVLSLQDFAKHNPLPLLSLLPQRIQRQVIPFSSLSSFCPISSSFSPSLSFSSITFFLLFLPSSFSSFHAFFIIMFVVSPSISFNIPCFLFLVSSYFTLSTSSSLSWLLSHPASHHSHSVFLCAFFAG